MSPTLLILAAGMGSRYGGLKQIDPFGPNGETIMDYAIYDALAAGFSRVVFVIRHDLEADFRKVVGSKYENRLAVEYAFQELDDLPPGFAAPSDRTKPWGTAHAIWCVRHRVREPFLSVNADDFYGKSAFAAAARHLMRPDIEHGNPERVRLCPSAPHLPTPAPLASLGLAKPSRDGIRWAKPGCVQAGQEALPEYCLVGYPILQTLSEHGAVARGICELDEQGYLKALVERKQVERFGDTGRYLDEAGNPRVLKGDEVVSMNMLGFTPFVFAQIERHLITFLDVQRQTPDNSECLIPVVVDRILKENAARMRVLPTSATWFGVTHAKDKPGVMRLIREMVTRGEYPSPIWNEA